MLMYLLWYLLIGIISMFTVTIIHIIRATKRGHDIEAVNAVCLNILYASTDDGKESILAFILKMVLLLLIFPVEIVTFIKVEDTLFCMYERIEKGSE